MPSVNAQNAATTETEDWPGPFATAHAMIAKRAEVKEKRLARIAGLEEGKVLAADEELDDYDALLQSLVELPKRAKSSPYIRLLPTLQNICLDFIVEHFDSISDLGDLSMDLREEICNRLGSLRCLTHSAALSLTSSGKGTLSITECSEISEETIIQVLEKLSSTDTPNTVAVVPLPSETVTKGKRKRKVVTPKEDEDDDSTQFVVPIRVLSLRNCGHCFGNRAALTLAHLGDRSSGPLLEDLTLTGCYRLSDLSLVALLNRCRLLRSLDLSCNSRLGEEGLRAIASLPLLQQLRLAFCAQLRDAELSLLSVPNSLVELRQLDLRGVAELTDAALDALLRRHGARLTHLCLRDCTKLTDAAAVSLRAHCSVLTSLDIGGCAFSAAALLGLFVTADPLYPSPTPPPAMHLETESILDKKEEIVSSLGRLVSFGVNSSADLTDEALDALCRSSADVLTTLDVSGCSQLTDRSLASVITHCASSLTSLDVSFVRSFSPHVLAALCSRAPRLSRLEVWGCTQINDMFFHEVSRHIRLSVRGGVSIGSA